MSQTTLRGIPASPGRVAGPIWHVPILRLGGDAVVPEADRAAELEVARSALATVASDLTALAADLPPSQASILETGVLMTSDPVLLDEVRDRVVADGMPAARALLAATGSQAELLAALEDAHLAARADDVRALGRQAAAAALSIHEPGQDAPEGAVVVAHDLGPGDIPPLAGRVAGIALAGGSATAHAAIVARSLGVPMVCELGDEVLDLPAGELVVLEGADGDVIVDPGDGAVREVADGMRERRAADERDRADRDRASVTVDGRAVAVLANATSVAEIEVALGYGATGVGLVRTELAFLEALRWPTAAEHRAAVEPLLVTLAGRPAVVRVLDLGADKAPPFLGSDVTRRGLALLLAERAGFEQQLAGLLPLAAEHDLRLMLPLVEDRAQLDAALAVVEDVADRLGVAPAPVGAMVETPGAVSDAASIAQRSRFLSIGTNDLTAATLGEDRFGGSVGPAHHPAVLRSIASTVAAARTAGIRVEVCGEAASTPLMAPLLVGLGVDELSVGAARVGLVRRWVRAMRYDALAPLAERALALDRPEEVEALMARDRAGDGDR